MARPPLPPGQKKEGVALDFSPLLIEAIDSERGSQSRSAYVESWLREKPELAAWLKEHQDAGFHPPVSRYEQLVDLLLRFYWPQYEHGNTIQAVLSLTHKIIMREITSTRQELEEHISGEMHLFWQRERAAYGKRNARGEDAESVQPAIYEYARFYVRAIFGEMAQEERALLQSRFKSLVRGCEAVYQARRAQR